MALDFDLNNVYEEGECSHAVSVNDNGNGNAERELINEYINLYGDGPTGGDEDNVAAEDDNIDKPAEGLAYRSSEELAAFAHTYAYKKGFTWYIRTNKLFEKYKSEGVSRKGSGRDEPRYHMYERLRLCCGHSSINTKACPVFIESRYCENEEVTKITKCHLEHNHELDPKSSRFFVGFRHINDYFKKRLLMNDAAGISILNNYKSLLLEGGSHENLGFRLIDGRNAINQERRRSAIEGDANELRAYFEKVKEQDPDFFYAIELDSYGVPMNVFWADSRCRAMFKVYGNAVTYDTTFLTNIYRMPFSPFVGVNQHGSSVVFACALVTRDYEESFHWVVSKFLECMGRAPSVMLTDQEKAICNAIEAIFPNTKHRLCLWHILKNAGKNLGRHELWNDIQTDLNLPVHDSLDAGDFEIAWNEMVSKYGIGENQWVKEQYSKKESWVPAYWRGTFCAGMSSTQRSEQQNRYFKSYVNGRTTLSQFAQKIEQALKLKVEDEAVNNHNCKEKPPKIECNLLVEQVFHKLYTNKIYKLVRDEVIGLIYTNADPPSRIGSAAMFKVEDKKVAPFGKRKTYWVDIDKSAGLLKCTCKLFEFKGIVCRHIIRCIVIEDVKVIPERYILDRWRKDLVREYETIKTGYYNPEASERAKKSLEVTVRNHYISTLALRDDETYAVYDRLSSELIKELEGIVGVETVDSYVPGGVSSKVWGKRRLQPRECNMRHMKRIAAAAPRDGRLNDPVDRRRSGRVPRGKKTPNGKKNKKNKTAAAKAPTANDSNILNNASSEFGETHCTRSRLFGSSQCTPTRSQYNASQCTPTMSQFGASQCTPSRSMFGSPQCTPIMSQFDSSQCTPTRSLFSATHLFRSPYSTPSRNTFATSQSTPPLHGVNGDVQLSRMYESSAEI